MYFFVKLSVHAPYPYVNWIIFLFLLVCKNFLYVKDIKSLPKFYKYFICL